MKMKFINIFKTKNFSFTYIPQENPIMGFFYMYYINVLNIGIYRQN